MATNNKVLNVVSWEKVKEMLPNENIHQELIDALDSVCSTLKKSQMDYFYLAEFEFGEYLISKGKLAFENVYINSANNKTTYNFKKDTEYTEDPLGLILEGNLEVFVDNYCNLNRYYVPITIIENGELFGTFGTLDYENNIKIGKKQRDWFVVCGNLATLYVASGLHTNIGGKEALNENIIKFFEQEDVNKKVDPSKWKRFINQYKDTKLNCKVLYFPKHIVDLLLKQNSSIIYKIGWKQAFPLRTVLFNDNEVANAIDKIRSESLKNNRIFLLNTYSFILKAVNGELPAFVPIKENINILENAIKNFSSQNPKVKPTFNQFLYRTVPKNEIGLLFLYCLPILNNYKISSLNDLLSDIKKINDEVKSNEYKVWEFIEGYNNTRAKDSLVKHFDKLKTEYLSKYFDTDKSKIVLTSNEFSNIILIKRK